MKKTYQTDKSIVKDNRITIRLTPNQQEELNYISNKLDMPKAKLMRKILDNFINQYYNYTNE